MKTSKLINVICFMIILFFVNGCVEPFNIETKSFENSLVIEATITNEFKNHEINLSRTFSLDKAYPIKERKASVKITDDKQNIYNFKEELQGQYISETKFKAVPNTLYQLSIKTFDGRSYTSNPTLLTSLSQIDNLYAQKQIDTEGNENISIFVDSFDPTGNAQYYRYEYEETYKIIAPNWNPTDLVVPSYVLPYTIIKVPKTKEVRTCYNTINSNEIIQSESTEFSNGKILKFPVRILSKEDPKISHRYSVLVKQYVQSIESYLYYKTTNKLSGSESLFSQNQPGFVSGNIISLDDENEKVIGFFDVSSVSMKRIYFNYTDFFPNQPLPPYFSDCTSFAPSDVNKKGRPSVLARLIHNATVKYYKDYSAIDDNAGNGEAIGESDEPGPYSVVFALCGDCTRIGSNIKPEFWID